MNSEKELRNQLSKMTNEELERYLSVLQRNNEMRTTHLRSMEENDFQMFVVEKCLQRSTWVRSA